MAEERCQTFAVPFVLTVDQRGSRRDADRVPEVLTLLEGTVTPLLGFERTAGDEFQGVLAEADDVVVVVLRLVRHGVGGGQRGLDVGPALHRLPRLERHPRSECLPRLRPRHVSELFGVGGLKGRVR